MPLQGAVFWKQGHPRGRLSEAPRLKQEVEKTIWLSQALTLRNSLCIE